MLTVEPCHPNAPSDMSSAGFVRCRPHESVQEMMNWVVRNGRWLDSIQDQLPEFVTVSSVQIYEDCNYDKVEEHLAGPMWRVQLLDGLTLAKLDIKLDGYEVVVPIEAALDSQDCKIKEEDVCPRLMPHPPPAPLPPKEGQT